MSKRWEGSVQIAAPVDEVYAYLADFTRHAEWDEMTERVEQVKAGDASGVGAEFKAYEALAKLAKVGSGDAFVKNQAGLAKREVTEMVPNKRIAWFTTTIPRMGITADCAFELAPEGNGTRLTQTVELHTLPGMDKVEKFFFRNMDAKQRAQWDANLKRIKAAVERAPALVGD